MDIFSKIKSALHKTSQKISISITGKKIDSEFLETLEEQLILTDIGFETTSELIKKISKHKFSKDFDENDIKQFLADEIYDILRQSESENFFEITNASPSVIMIIGVNGNGKTTTSAKIANILKSKGRNPMLVAGDTFRAAAVEQLEHWANNINVKINKGKPNGDSASLAYESIELAKKNNNDVVIIDTAGRMQNREDLLAELEKINRVVKKLDESAPHHSILIIDGLTGQAAHNQVEAFMNKIKLDGVIITKLDGTAKGGSLVAMSQKYKLKILAIGIGESIDDLREFSARDYANALVGLNKL